MFELFIFCFWEIKLDFTWYKSIPFRESELNIWMQLHAFVEYETAELAERAVS